VEGRKLSSSLISLYYHCFQEGSTVLLGLCEDYLTLAKICSSQSALSNFINIESVEHGWISRGT